MASPSLAASKRKLVLGVLMQQEYRTVQTIFSRPFVTLSVSTQSRSSRHPKTTSNHERTVWNSSNPAIKAQHCCSLKAVIQPSLMHARSHGSRRLGEPTLRPGLDSRRSFSASTRRADRRLTSSSIAIIGAGDTGSTIAYSISLNPIAGEVLLVDPATDFCEAQAQDLSDATNFGSTPVRIRKAEHKEAGQCDVIVMTAGAAQQDGESRTDLVGKNVKIMKSALEDCKPFRKDAVLLVVANPVDVLTHFAQKISGLPRSQVFGSGTFLDTARLKGILARQSGVAAGSIEGYVLGEHGESQVVAWSHASIGGIPLDAVVKESTIAQAKIAEETKNAAAAIIQAKGVTAFGIGGVAASLCKSILFDERNIRPVSFWQDDLEVCLSMPAVIGREGIVRSIPMSLNEQENNNLKESAKSLREIIQDAERSLEA